MEKWLTDLANDPTRVTVVAAWFTGTAVFVAAVVGAVVSFLVSRRAAYINSVTSERSKWIEALRGTVAKLSATAERISTLRRDPVYVLSEKWANDTQELHRLLSDLMLRLNPAEPEAMNLLKAARKLNAAARLHSSAAVDLADEIMVRHAQWVLKAEWERVKEEAAGSLQAPRFWWRKVQRQKAYRKFVQRDGSLVRLDEIGVGRKDIDLTLLRSEMDLY